MHDELTAIFTELGPLCPAIEDIIEYPDEPRWALALEGDLFFAADYDEATGALCLCADVGQPQAAHRDAVWEAMLVYSSLRQSNGGFWTALAEPGGECQLLCDIGTRELDAQRLQNRVLQLAEKARLWRELVAQGADPSKLNPAVADLLDFSLRC